MFFFFFFFLREPIRLFTRARVPHPSRRKRHKHTHTTHTYTHPLSMDATAFGDTTPGESVETAAGVAAPSPPPALREDMVENAVGFLVHPKVRAGGC